MNPFEQEADGVASEDGRRLPSRGRSIQMRPVYGHGSSSHALSVDYTHNGPPVFTQAGEDEDKEYLPSRLHASRSVDTRSESGTHRSSQFDLGPAPPYQASPQPRPANKQETKSKSKGPLRHIIVWASECFWLLLTVAAFVAMVVVLWRYDNKQLPNWPLGLTLNTAVAFLATLCRSTAVIPVTEALSQLKWNWFVTGQRPVRDLHVIDQATRYPWASLEMLTRMRGRIWPLGFMASAVLVTGIVTSFVTQSAIGYSTRLVGTAQDNVTTSYSRSYPPAKVMDGDYVEQDYLAEFERAAFQAVFYPVTHSWPAPDPVCTSADCRWEPFSSLAICVSMANVTDRLDIQVEENEDLSGIVLNATLLDGQAYLQEAVGGIGTQGEDEDEGGDMDVSRRRRGSMLARSAARIMNLTSPEYDSRDPQDSSRPNFPPRRPTIGFGAAEDEDTLRSAFFQLLFIYTNEAIDSGDKDHRFRAAEVLWHFCVHTYDVGVEDGVTRTSVAAAHVEIVDVENESNDVTNYFTLADAEGRDRFNVTQAWAYERLDGDLRRAFAGAYSTNYGPDDDYSEFNAEFGNNMGKGVDPSAMGPQEIDAKVWANLQAMTGNVAQSMTAHLRNSDDSISGEALTSQTFVTVRWAWLAFLAAQIGLSFVFLLAVMLYTAALGVDVVKSTSVAELFAMRPRGFSEPRGIRPSIDGQLVGRLRKEGHLWNLEVHRKDSEWPLQGG